VDTSRTTGRKPVDNGFKGAAREGVISTLAFLFQSRGLHAEAAFNFTLM
jgi:hypothetical protein